MSDTNQHSFSSEGNCGTMNIEIKGVQVPALGFGTWTLRGRKCADAVRMALDIGYRHIDTARMYGNEIEVGRAVGDSGVGRSDIFITTKIWPDDLAYADAKRCTDDSLRNLATDYIDLLLIHWPSKSIPLDETLRALAEIKEEGKARLIGVSNFNTALLREAVEECGADIACNQVEYHPFLSQNKVLAAVREYGMMLTAYMPLAKGRVAQHPTLIQIAESHGKTGAQVALRWLIQQGPIAAIPKSGSEAHCRENFDVFDFALTDVEMTEISALLTTNDRIADFSLGPVWDAP